MAYHLYNVEGFILASRALGETGRLYTIFTPQLGLIKAIAAGVREEKSKLRYSLSPYSHGEISLIKGKEFWRLVGSEKTNLLDYLSECRVKRKMIARVFSLLVRLIHGEEESQALFEDLKFAFSALGNYGENEDSLANWETVCVLVVLKHLGYLKVTSELAPFVEEKNWEEDKLKPFTSLRVEAIKTINYLLRRSHL